jgi:hypothetical protein
MTQQLDTRKALGQETAQKSQKLGRVWPNLVFTTDLEKKYVEFKAQCEVWLSPEDARMVQDLLTKQGATQADFERAIEIILKQAETVAAAPEFKDMVAHAIRCQPTYKAARPKP